MTAASSFVTPCVTIMSLTPSSVHISPSCAFAHSPFRGVQLNAAGSLANTLAACALLGTARDEAEVGRGLQRPRVAMAGPIGDDHLGQFFQAHFSKVGVDWIEEAQPNTGTGTCIVLTTPDAQRSFLSYPGPPRPLQLSESTYSVIQSSRCLVVEGYLWELPNAAPVIARAIKAAKEAGRVVALTVADVSVVRRFRAEMLEAMRSADVIFTNAEEASALVSDGLASSAAAPAEERSGKVHCAHDAALQLGRMCPVAVVTDGARGSCVSALGHLYAIPPHWVTRAAGRHVRRRRRVRRGLPARVPIRHARARHGRLCGCDRVCRNLAPGPAVAARARTAARVV